MKGVLAIILMAVVMAGCQVDASQEKKDKAAVQQQQAQYAKRQPIPTFDFSLERHLVSQLYQVRNNRAATHSVWRSNTGLVEGDCPSMGYGLPYDTSLTNPLQRVGGSYGVTAIEQAEPNGIFASKNTQATWVMCLGTAGVIEPVYVESKVTAYPFPVAVDYETNRVTKAGESTVQIRADKG